MSNGRLPRWVPWLAIASLVLGIFLRWLWTGDMEYKFDEQYMFLRSQAVGITEHWPAVGMASGVGLVNPGLSIWIFVGLARIFRVTTPLGLEHAVVFLACLALLVLAYVAVRVVEKHEREGWLWALILVSVNPFLIQMERKIWAQSTLPLFSIVFLWAWLRRKNAIGAFLWGLVGALLGQIHMSGFFFAGSFVLWTFFKKRSRRETRWQWWLAGSVLGALPLIPWISYVLVHPSVKDALPWTEILNFRFWCEWAYQIVGLPVRYTLGREGFHAFVRLPEIGGHPVYLMAVAQLAAIASGALILLLGLRDFFGTRIQSETQTAQNATFWGFGWLLELSRAFIHRHYLLVCFPIQYLWISRLALGQAKWIRFKRGLLFTLWVSTLAISVGFLSYIHMSGGAPGDYGIAYSSQHAR